MTEAATHAHAGPSYRTVFLALIVLTGATVGVYYVDLGHTAGIIVALAIASCKATMVGLYFMHLRFEIPSLYIVIGVPVVLTVILVVALLPDIGHIG